jgi:hypothetical protein
MMNKEDWRRDICHENTPHQCRFFCQGICGKEPQELIHLRGALCSGPPDFIPAWRALEVHITPSKTRLA